MISNAKEKDELYLLELEERKKASGLSNKGNCTKNHGRILIATRKISSY